MIRKNSITIFLLFVIGISVWVLIMITQRAEKRGTKEQSFNETRSVNHEKFTGNKIFPPASRKKLCEIPRGEKNRVVETRFDIENNDCLLYMVIQDKDSLHSFILFNDKEGKSYDRIENLVLASDGNNFAYVAKEGCIGLLVSGCKNKKSFVVLNGKEGERYDRIIWGPKFFAGGTKLLYVAVQGCNWTEDALTSCRGGKYSLVVNDQEGKWYDDILTSGITLSSDEQEFVYVANNGCALNKDGYCQGGQYFVVHSNQIEGTPYEKIWIYPKFSPDGKTLVYIAETSGKDFIVLNGREEQPYDLIKVDSLRFSQDSEHFVYIAKNDSDAFVVLDGKELKQFVVHGPSHLEFSPDGMHFAYVAVDEKSRLFGILGINRKEFIVLDSQARKQYDDVFSIIFAPKGDRMAYIANEGCKESMRLGSEVYCVGGKYFVVMNDEEGKRYDDINEWNVFFSSDGKRVAYVANEGCKFTPTFGKFGKCHGHGGQDFVVWDNQEGARYNRVEEQSVTFSPDGEHIAYSAIRENIPGKGEGWSKEGFPQKEFVIIDNQEERKFQEIDYTSVSNLTFSLDSRNYMYVASKNYGTKQSVVLNGIDGEQYDQIYKSSFSKDGMSLQYLARLGQDIYLITQLLK